ncbi:acyl-CoA dehydrogenase family protein [Microbacterium sp. RD1]|uniref:acyl-CoA dehydrogenase family protein n=1 Tax=Microbacterium sp. RD1 TaxID=3457313 RepID=UPI003FA5FC3E
MNDNEEELRALVEDIVGSHPASGDEPGRRLAIWADLREAGLHRVGIDESAGGSGGSFDDLTVVVHALSSSGARTPIVEAAVADRIRSAAGALDDRWGSAAYGGDPLVPWGTEAEFAVVLRGDGAVLVDGPLPLEGRDVSAVPLGRATGGAETASLSVPEDTTRAWDLLLTAALAGSAEGIYRRTREYVRERMQFDRPLIDLPAVQGRLGEMKMRLVQSRAVLDRARERGDDAAVASARSVVSAAASALAAHAHQLHGAIGITREFGLWPFTTTVWAVRDQVRSASEAAASLGREAVGESVVWDDLTAW